MRVAAVQLEPKIGDVGENLRRCRQLGDQAAAAGAEWIVLPEFFTTGMGFRARLADAALPVDGAGTELLLVAGDGPGVVTADIEPGRTQPTHAVCYRQRHGPTRIRTAATGTDVTRGTGRRRNARCRPCPTHRRSGPGVGCAGPVNPVRPPATARWHRPRPCARCPAAGWGG